MTERKHALIRDLDDGTIDSRWAISAEVRRSFGSDPPPSQGQARELERIVERNRPAGSDRDYWPDLQFLSNWTGGTMRAYLRGYPEYFGATPVRDVGLIASEGRMTIPIEDGTPAGILDIRHHYFEFIPEDHAEQRGARDGRGHRPGRGSQVFHRAHDRGRAVSLQHFATWSGASATMAKAPLIEFLNKGAHYSSLTGEKLSEHQVIAAVEAAQRSIGIHLKSYLLAPTWDEPPFYSLLVEEDDLATEELDRSTREPGRARIAGARTWSMCASADTLRLGPVRIVRIPGGSWVEFQKRRLAQSGGTVEQYKQPHLVADLELAESFRRLEPVV